MIDSVTTKAVGEMISKDNSISLILSLVGNPLGAGQIAPAVLYDAMKDLLDIQKDLRLRMHQLMEQEL